MSSFYKLVFILMGGLGCFISMSGESWFSVWFGMEVGTFFFTAILASFHSSGFVSMVATWKYFIYQSIGSLLILYGMVFTNSSLLEVNSLWVLTGLVMKMGLFPLQGWVFFVLENSSLICILLFSTMQKIPLLVICYWLGTEEIVWYLLKWCVLLSAFWISVACLEHMVSLKMILVMSSILSSSWMVGGSICSWVDLVVFFSFYTIHFILFLSSIQKLPFLGSISSSFWKSSSSDIFGVICLGMLVGVPPFGVFFSKVTVLYGLIGGNNSLIGLVLLMSSMVMLFCYMNFALSFLLKSKSGFSKKLKSSLMFFLFTGSISLVLLVGFF